MLHQILNALCERVVNYAETPIDSNTVAIEDEQRIAVARNLLVDFVQNICDRQPVFGIVNRYAWRQETGLAIFIYDAVRAEIQNKWSFVFKLVKELIVNKLRNNLEFVDRFIPVRNMLGNE